VHYKKEPFVTSLSIDLVNYCFITPHAQYVVRIVQYQTALFLCILEVHIWFLDYFICMLLHCRDVCELSFGLSRENMIVC